MSKNTIPNWQFIDHEGTFQLENPHQHSYLYFPLVNEVGMMSAITPTLHGDIKTDQNAFLTPPVSVEDLHTSRAARNFWVFTSELGAWSVTGNSAPQIAQQFSETEKDEMNVFCLHQANKFILDYLAKKMKIRNKTPLNVEKFGNTSCASIPLLIVSNKTKCLVKNAVLCGFGVGWSLRVCMVNLENATNSMLEV